MPLAAAGTRPEPAVSVPSARSTMPGGHGDGRAGARPAGDESGPVGVRADAVGRAGADQAGGELVHVRLADHDGAGVEQGPDGRRVGRRVVGVGRAAGGGGQAGDVDVVLHRERASRPAAGRSPAATRRSTSRGARQRHLRARPARSRCPARPSAAMAASERGGGRRRRRWLRLRSPSCLLQVVELAGVGPGLALGVERRLLGAPERADGLGLVGQEALVVAQPERGVLDPDRPARRAPAAPAGRAARRPTRGTSGAGRTAAAATARSKCGPSASRFHTCTVRPTNW